jgi:spore coat polysaccharide biosynthesis predicted glycosyltransferase SpsG
MRCLALAEELTGRGHEVVMLADLGGLDWLSVPSVAPPDDLVKAARDLDLDAMVLDSYDLGPRWAGALREAGVTVLCIVDGDTRGQDADLYLDQNLGARAGSPRFLAGLGYVLLRDSVRRLRPPRPPRPDREIPRVVCFFGGTDPAGAAPAAMTLAAGTGVPFAATVVAPRGLPPIRLFDGQSIVPIAPSPDLPELVASADLVIGAAGSSTWELLCLGIPAAVTWVAANQRPGHDAVVAAGLAVGLGHITDLPSRAGALRRLLTDRELRRELAERGPAVVDGDGRVRVADALTAAVAAPEG